MWWRRPATATRGGVSTTVVVFGVAYFACAPPGCGADGAAALLGSCVYNSAVAFCQMNFGLAEGFLYQAPRWLLWSEQVVGLLSMGLFALSVSRKAVQ